MSLIVLLAIFIPTVVTAGSFQVVPLKISFDSKTNKDVVKIINNDSEKITIQLDAKHWSQDKKGEDQYTETSDIVFFPKIVTIEGGTERIIRVGYQGEGANSIEKNYRLFLQELPVSKPGEKALKFVLTVSIPVFIEPNQKRLLWSLEDFEYQEGNATVTVKNDGNSHILVSKLGITMLDGAGTEMLSKDIGGWYVLPGSAKVYRIPVSEKDCKKSSVIKLRVDAADMQKNAKLNLDQAVCKPSSGAQR